MHFHCILYKVNYKLHWIWIVTQLVQYATIRCPDSWYSMWHVCITRFRNMLYTRKLSIALYCTHLICPNRNPNFETILSLGSAIGNVIFVTVFCSVYTIQQSFTFSSKWKTIHQPSYPEIPTFTITGHFPCVKGEILTLYQSHSTKYNPSK